MFLLFGLFGVGIYIRSQTSDALVIELASSYMRICSVLSFGCVVYMIYEKLLQATGRTMPGHGCADVRRGRQYHSRPRS